MRVQCMDGAVFEGPDAKSIVSQMRKDEWNAPSKKREYMAEVSDRVEQMTGQDVPDDNAMAFLTGLEAQGFLTIAREAVGSSVKQ
jgi:hypothetical protein